MINKIDKVIAILTFAAMNAKEYFGQLSSKTADVIKKLKSQLLKNSLVRLFVFFIAVAGVYFFWGNTTIIFIVVLMSIAAFLVLVRYHSDLKSKLKVEQAVLSNCEDEIRILNGDWRDREEGKEFIDSDHSYAADLNVFGKHGIFQYLNRTKTNLAKTRIAEWLKSPLIKPEEIEKEQEIIAELAKHPGFLMRLLAYAEFLKADAQLFANLEIWSKEKEFKRSKAFWAFTNYFVPAYAIVSTILFSLDILTFNLYLLTLILPGALVGMKLAEHQKRFTKLLEILFHADQFGSMLELIKSEKFESKAVQELLLNMSLEKSTKGIAELRKIVGAVESRNNVLVSIVLNLLLMWDFHTARRLNKWKETYASQVPQWLLLANTFETYASFAIFVYNHPAYKYAEFTNKQDFEMDNARHILMNESAVANSLQIANSKRFFIITGANMAGKSTYLRTIGTNLILAMRGLPVNVSAMRFKPTQLFTSMLAADSLGDNESYFFNELKRLRQMTDKLEAGQPLFVILDEILKGTNSVDKAEGSKKFMEKLLKLPVKGLIATHDLSLCNLSELHPQEIENKKFEVRFDGDELAFDYKLESGVCQNMNASFLLKKMGLTE
ncbi:hypothetical protein G3O08_08870 [Cryomorpha ignava]|uniref:DNA mismatch repair proteins mutS family domain-containing protein n=1 Tax=Cryomorpha ignava TaxID=101383 RepID=A0A7K3WRY2_9FLAO|nr:hypothetical protein [Cryomorpha ignava]NEN23612.1 hypothetical protein [Cryomorpha ignava]